ncbi:MAG TPA: pilus assembly protein TadG-related protein [Solidesulfovibrio sp.]|nr:pilus assembly protein TadG-related protein [Solidesulfovibrio sp.]
MDSKTQHPGDQRGSVTVFVTLLLPTLMLMAFLMLNIGQLIFEKIRLQNTVDACALSAAAVQAAGLNEIAETNFWSKDYVMTIAKTVMQLSQSMPWQNQSTANSAVNYYKEVFKNLRKYQDNANTYYAEKALSIAKAVKKANLDDCGIKSVTLKSINPKSGSNNSGKLMEYKTSQKTLTYSYIASQSEPPLCPILVALNWSDSQAGDKKHFGTHMGASPTATCGLAPASGTSQFDYKISKKSTPMTYSAFKLTQESKEFVVAGLVFGSMKKMEAYAAAMPTGGNVEEGKPEYKAVLVRLGKLTPKPDVSDLDDVLH